MSQCRHCWGETVTGLGRWELEGQALFAFDLLSTPSKTWTKAGWETPKMPENKAGFPKGGGAIAPILQDDPQSLEKSKLR